MSTLYARFVVALISLLTSFFGRWRRQTIVARVHALLAPTITTAANGTPITFFTPDRTSVYWPRHGLAAEPDTLQWIDGFVADDVLYDIGANVGAYSIYAAKRKGVRVIAVEPNPFSFHVLARNLVLNGVLGKVTPLCLALGAGTDLGILALKDTECGSVGHSLARGEGPARKGALALQTQVCRLDTLCADMGQPPPNHIKIDVDGIEHEILMGAEAALRDSRLKSVAVEFYTHDQPVRDSIAALLDDFDLAPTSAGDRQDGYSDNCIYVRRGAG
ncbi:MAG: FkbM family methyltransferase [Rhodospirillales bacterium]|jgi:FkbM family methyltransferase|nr:FkbM family methyltransferase [Rhodospirillales bacterium]